MEEPIKVPALKVYDEAMVAALKVYDEQELGPQAR